MSKRLMLAVIAFFAGNFLWAQKNKLEIRGTGSSIYVEHVVTPKENFYSVGRMFNISPKTLATYNHLHFASGLSIGQVLKIPLTNTNFTQHDVAAPGEALIPVYHSVAPGETLYRLGVNYNKVSLTSLRDWNHLSSDALRVGEPMIIGFLKVDRTQSPLASEEPMTNVPSAQSEKVEKAEEKPSEAQPETRETTPPSVPETTPPQAQQQNTGDNANLTITPTKVNTSENTTVTNTNENPAETNPSENATTASATTTSDASGYFKNLYQRQTGGASTIDKNGTAGVFKSTSGWQDAKYYCFSNDAAAGTVLKITDNATGKSVYAKVLDAIPDISQNEGLLTVISNAAAQKLGAGENKFDCTVTFVKQ